MPPRLSTLATHLQRRLRNGPQTLESTMPALPYQSVSKGQVASAYDELVNAGLASFDAASGQYSLQSRSLSL